ncbi:MAG TPA: alpha/beta hydrolase [Gemmatirosa sp.]|nr:alpha/beta hydrolase [Gemmatirosa sp.]
MPSLPNRLFTAYARLVIRRRRWGDTPAALARRARRLFGAPPALQRLATRGLAVRPVHDAATGVRGEWLTRPSNTSRTPTPPGVLLYVHGGGFVAGSAADHRTVTAALARALGLPVFACDYRLAPEAPFPAALDDVCAAYRWLLDRGAPDAPVAVAGESAGGGLALLLAQHARDAGWAAPACVAALSPWADLTGQLPAVRANEGRCAMFHPENLPAFAGAYLGDVSPAHPRASPLAAAADGLPPVLLQVGADELLLDDARAMHARIRAAGGESRLEEWPDVAHGWHLMAPLVPEASRAIDAVATFVRAALARGAEAR